MVQTLEQAEKYFDIDNVPTINILRERNKHNNPKIQRILVILNYIRFKKQLIKYDLIDNQEDVLILWEDKPEIQSW